MEKRSKICLLPSGVHFLCAHVPSGTQFYDAVVIGVRMNIRIR